MVGLGCDLSGLFLRKKTGLGCCRDWVYIEILLVGSEEKECVFERDCEEEKKEKKNGLCTGGWVGDVVPGALP